MLAEIDGLELLVLNLTLIRTLGVFVTVQMLQSTACSCQL
jgi:hypothetical protein